MNNKNDQGLTPSAPGGMPPVEETLLLRQQLQQAQDEISRLKASLVPQASPEVPPEALSPDQAMEKLLADPVGFIHSLIDTSAEKHLAALKEEAELRGALNAARKQHPEFHRFEPFIMNEVASLIKNDPDGSIDPWDKLLEKGLESFRRKFKDTLKDEVVRISEGPAEAPVPHMEGGANRAVPEALPSFTREQIARMSLDEFLRHEAAINLALQNNRIR